MRPITSRLGRSGIEIAKLTGAACPDPWGEDRGRNRVGRGRDPRNGRPGEDGEALDSGDRVLRDQGGGRRPAALAGVAERPAVGSAYRSRRPQSGTGSLPSSVPHDPRGRVAASLVRLTR